MIGRFRAGTSADEEGETGKLDGLQRFVVDAIVGTEKLLFPDAVRLETIEDCPEWVDRRSVVLRRMCDAGPDEFRRVFRPRDEQDLTQGQYYLLKPTYRRDTRRTRVEDLVLFPLWRPATAVGCLPQKSLAFLVEGVRNVPVFETLLTRFNPYWKARIEVHDKRGASNLGKAWENYRAAGGHAEILAILDADKTRIAAAIRARGGRAFVLSPDLEGVCPDALLLALRRVRPQLEWQLSDVSTIVAETRTKRKSTAKLIRDYEWGRGQTDTPESLKKDLAPALGQQLLAVGSPDTVMDIIARAVKVGFGHTSS